MKMSKGFRAYSSVAVGLLAVAIFAPVGNATTLTPGQSVCATGCTFSPIQDFAAGFFFTSPIADTGPIALTGLNALSQTVFTGTLEEWVATDVNTGGLDFLYQVVNNAGSTDAMQSVSVASYAGFTTDVGYCSNPGGGGAVPCGSPLGGVGNLAPTSITRNSAATVDFGFSPSGIGAGVQTYDLVVKTNATAYTLGTTQVIDDGVASVITLAPSATPEPVSAGLLLGGLFGAGLFVARRFRVPQN